MNSLTAIGLALVIGAVLGGAIAWLIAKVKQGAQLAAADAQEARAAAMTQGFQGMAGMAGYAAEMVPLYMQTKASKEFGAQQAEYSKRAAAGQLGAEYMIDGKTMTMQQAIQKKFGLDVGKMKQEEFESYMTGKGRKYVKQYDLFGE
jgi:hypothetical protein